MITLVIIVAATMLVSAMCSLFEAVLYSTRMGLLEAAATEGKHQLAAHRMLGMKRNIASPTSAILILNTLANTAGAALAGMVAGIYFGGYGVALMSAGLTLGILFFSEILPKTYGAVHWRSIWPYIVSPLVWMRRLLFPLIKITQAFSEFFTGTTKVPSITEEEILASIYMGEKEGELTREERRLISAVFRFDDMVARQLIVPRREVIVLRKDWTISECLEVAKTTGHSRYPVCTESLDDAVGLLHIKDLIRVGLSENLRLGDLVRPLPTIPDTMSASRLLRQMQRTRKHMAVAVDEHGTALGIVTLENVLEQIVGAVQDEFDDEAPEIVPDGTGRFIVRGFVTIERINHELDLDLFSDDADTIGGLLVAKAGRLLRTGDEVQLEGAIAEVVDARGDRARKIRIILPRAGETSSAPTGSASEHRDDRA
jgi:CBS domain containing-hemolysin-like protein